MKKWAAWALVCILLFFMGLPALSEEAGEDLFVDPTRDPNAPEYFTSSPGDLQKSQIIAASFILMERSEKKVLLERDSDVARFPASTTKILTALMALEFGNITDTITMSETAMDIPSDSSRVPFKLGETITLEDALYGMMLRSGNEAANAVAEYVAGDIPTFVRRMNETAAILGCKNTHFVTAHGYHDEAHYTTAYDMALIMDAALDNATFRKIIASDTYDLHQTMMNPARKIENSNLHIHKGNNYYYQWSIGGKTGFTSQAGQVLVEAAEQDGVELIAVVMYSSKYGRWPDTSRLFQYGFSMYDSITPEQVYNENPMVLQINGFDPESEGYGGGNVYAPEDARQGRLKLEIRPVDEGRRVRITKSKEEIETIRENFSMYTIVKWQRDLRAPVTAGEVMGILTFYPDGQDEVQYELVATRSIAARQNAPPTLEDIERRVAEDPAFFPPFGWDWVLPPILVFVAAVLSLRALIKLSIKRRRSKKQIPMPKRRYFS